MAIDIHPLWSQANRRRLAQLIAEMGEPHIEATYPNICTILAAGPHHPAADNVSGLVAQMIGPKSVDLWKPRLAGDMIRTACELYDAFGPGARDRTDTQARRRWFRLIDTMQRAEDTLDMPAVRKVVARVLDMLPEDCRDVSSLVPVPTTEEWEASQL